jgi:hypothetical protein
MRKRVKEKHHIEVSNTKSGLQLWWIWTLEVEFNRAWKTIRQNIKISAKEILRHYKLKEHEPWFHKGCPELLDQRKQAKLYWLQDPSEINVDNLNNVRCKTTGPFQE